MKHRFEMWRLLPGARRFLAELESEKMKRLVREEGIFDVMQSALDELEECQRRGQVRSYEGTAEVHSDGDPPIVYAIYNLKRILGRGR